MHRTEGQIPNELPAQADGPIAFGNDMAGEDFFKTAPCAPTLTEK